MIYRGGLPYGPEFDKLDAAFPLAELTEGRIIPTDALAQSLGIGKSPRFYSIIRAWRGKQAAQRNINLEFRDGGLKVLDPAAMLGHSEDRFGKALKGVRRAARCFSRVDRTRLDETGQKRYDHQAHIAARTADMARDTQRQIAVELAPIRSLPRRLPQGATE